MTFIENFKKQLNSNTPSAPSHSTFEETYKNSYSHGLEAIYALETVDVKSIRPILPQAAQRTAVPKSYTYSHVEIVPDQLDFDFGDFYRGWIDSFVKLEPIHVLGLSRHAEKCLFDHGKRILDDLINSNLKEFVFLKGMGQGHVDEIQQKLSCYLAGRPLTRCTKIDFASWIRSIVAFHDRKKVFVAMEGYHLSDLFSLSPAESVETRRLTLEKKREWIQEAHAEFQTPAQCKAIKEQVCKIADVFIKPWMQRRHGLATRQEIIERIQRLSTNSAEASNAISFLSDLYFGKEFLFQEFLIPLEDEIFCLDEFAKERYIQVVQRACSYFYNPRTVYPLEQLIGFLEREFALAWEGFPEGCLHKILRLSPCFCTRKGNAGKLEIRIA